MTNLAYENICKTAMSFTHKTAENCAIAPLSPQYRKYFD